MIVKDLENSVHEHPLMVQGKNSSYKIFKGGSDEKLS